MIADIYKSGKAFFEKEEFDYETAIRNMECRTERLFNTKTPEAVTASGVDFSEITEIISLRTAEHDERP